ncbi:calcium-binding protein [Rhodophyticola sp.]|uniref:calcium-binding protein n=1 Tax=Rhodophyticola sp. TaxID=2680032 RepID=UPI003D2992A1
MNALTGAAAPTALSIPAATTRSATSPSASETLTVRNGATQVDVDAALAAASNDGAGNVVVDFGAGDTLTFNGLSAADIQVLIGNAGGRVAGITASATTAPSLVTGGIGDDTLSGAFNNDTLIGGDGNDVINAGFGFDSVDAGEGDDLVVGLNGFDTIHGNAGNDTLSRQRGQRSAVWRGGR